MGSLDSFQFLPPSVVRMAIGWRLSLETESEAPNRVKVFSFSIAISSTPIYPPKTLSIQYVSFSNEKEVHLASQASSISDKPHRRNGARNKKTMGKKQPIVRNQPNFVSLIFESLVIRFVGRLTLRADVFHQEVDCLEPAVALFDAVVVEALRFLVPLGHDFGGVQEMLDADGKLVRFAPQVVKVRSREECHGGKDRNLR